MKNDKVKARPWAGLALLMIAGIHSAFGVLVGFRILPDPEMRRLVGERVPLLELKPVFFQNVPLELAPLTMFWFLFFGFAIASLGALVRHLEKNAQPVPILIGYHLMVLGLGGVLFLPVSGFWLVLLPAVNILRHGQRAKLMDCGR